MQRIVRGMSLNVLSLTIGCQIQRLAPLSGAVGLIR